MEPKRRKADSWACRPISEFEKLNRVEEGAYGVVYRARDKRSGEVVALKKVKVTRTNVGFPLTALREINLLINLRHENIVALHEVASGREAFFLVMEWLEHDLQVLMEDMPEPFKFSEIKCLMLQLLDGLRYMHENWVVHRDLKTSNLLMNNRGVLKIADFGLARAYSTQAMTPGVCTIYYRAPELLVAGDGYAYTTAIDMWSAGCIFGELVRGKVLIAGTSEMDQLTQTVKLLGRPKQGDLPKNTALPNANWSNVALAHHSLSAKFPPQTPMALTLEGTKLLLGFLTYNPERRLTAAAALHHPFFTTERPMPKKAADMPTFRSAHESAPAARAPPPSRAPEPTYYQSDAQFAGSVFGGGGVNTDAYLQQLAKQK